MVDALTGKLLVATPVLEDANFRRAVVLLLAHDENGAFGVVLNRPRPEAPVADHVPAWSEHAAAPAMIFAGGPVEPAMALALAAGPRSPEADGWQPMAAGVGLLDLAREPEGIGMPIERMRVFSGYAGWGGGQLEAEIEQNAWFVVDVKQDDVFTAAPERLWRDVLMRQRSDLKMYAHFPDDPSLN
jgi:putative transcriptional regulator